MAHLRIASIVLGAILSTLVLASPTGSIQEAEQLFNQGRHEVALEKVNGYLTDHPKDPQGRFFKGMILAQMNRHQEAIDMFAGLTEDHPELPEAYNNLAVLYAAQGRYEQARRSLEMAVLAHPGYATAHENLGDLYAKMATQSYEKSLKLGANSSVQTKAAAIKSVIAPTQETPTAPAPKTSPLAAKPVEPMPSLPQPEKAAPSVAAAKTDKTAPARTEPVPEPAKAAPRKAETPAQPPQAAPAPVQQPAPARKLEMAALPATPIQATPIQEARLSPSATTAEGAASPVAKPAEEADQSQIERVLRAWAEELRIRRGYTKVELSDLAITVNGDQAEAKCLQRYQSQEIWGWTMKTFKFTRHANALKIVQER